MFVAIYKSRHTGEIEFDETIHRFNKGREGWDIIAVAIFKADQVSTTDPDQAHTYHAKMPTGNFTAREVLEGEAGPILVWHRAMSTD